MKGALLKAADSAPLQFILNLLIYAFYTLVLGVSLAPSAALAVWGIGRSLSFMSMPPGAAALSILVLGLSVGAAFFLYLIWGSVFMGASIRLLSLGIRPGTYPAVSLTCVRWILYNGIFTIAVRTILPITVMSLFCRMFFRLLGCRMGRNVYINTPNLNDPQFLEIEDNVVIGGASDVSCHTFERGRLILGRIRIGEGTVIGAHAYISPNVTIGRRCTIGVNTIIRKNHTIPDGSVIGTPAGLPIRSVARIERENKRSAGRH